ncbi:MAG: FG-GAP repeat protein [Planctomycetaceae bacterium]|nr:FG-GAP repeat protein [Planctomycetales bacterium]MCB9875097.1 FG-GAP repeat protein [Planctomycetaceae bacterium]
MAVLPLAELRDGGASDSQGFVLTSVIPQDQTGFSVSNAGDINADGYDDLLIGAPVAPGFPAGTGGTYVIYGKSFGFSDITLTPNIAAADGKWLFGLNAADHMGFSVSDAGDVNADGFHDFIIGAPYADRNTASGTLLGTGQAYLVFGSSNPLPNLTSLNGTNGFLLKGLLEYDRSGWSVATAGDINGDGFDDFLVGTPVDDLSVTAGIGKAYVVYGKGTAFSPTVNLWELSGSSGFQLFGLAASDHLGTAVNSVGDLNGDGFDDLAVSSPYADPSGLVGAGTGYIIFGGTNPAQGVNQLDGTNGFRVNGGLPHERAGFSISSAGDFNGDGFDDLLVGAPGDRNNPWDYDTANPAGSGVAYVIYGKASGFSASINLRSLDGSGNGFSITGIDGTVVAGVDGVDYAGFSVSSAGDVDGDGFSDLIIGAPYADSSSSSGVGESYLIFGRPGGFANGLTLATLTDDQGMRLIGDRFLDRSGYSVSAAGDINGDGFDDVLIGAPSSYPYSGSAGRSYVLFGRDFRGKQPIVGTEGDSDLTGTTGADALIGAQGNDLLHGAGGPDVLRGGQGNDILGVSDLTFRQVAGGRGVDTLRLEAAGLTLDLSAIPNNRITGIEQIDITGTGNNTLVIGGVREVLNLSDTSNRLIVRRDLGDLVTIGTGWTEIAPVNFEGKPFRVYTQGAASLAIENPPPRLDLNGDNDSGLNFQAAFTEDQPPVTIVDTDLIVSDDASLASASITITNLMNGVDESLSVTVGSSGLTSSYNPTLGKLTLTGSASASVYQTVLRTLQYRNASNAPVLTARLITAIVNDGVSNSPTATATVTLTSVNDAPILSATPTPVFSPVVEDTADPAGNLVASVVRDGSIVDPDGVSLKSIAVVGTSTGNGTWQYKVADDWLDFGVVSTPQARLLASTARLRFVPNPDFSGTATLRFRAWDQTVGTAGTEHDTSASGGTSAFSFNIVTATLTVQGVNDAPVLDPSANHVLTAIDEDKVNSVGDTVSAIVQTGAITDIDGPLIGGIAIVAVDNANGVWQHGVDTTSWTTITASPTSALLLSAQRRVRFVPNANFHGTASFSFRAWDQSTGTAGGTADTTVTGGTSAFSTVQENAVITVIQIDDPPTLDRIPAVILDTTITSHDIHLSGITDGDEGNEVLSITATSNNHDILPDPIVTYSSPSLTGTLTLAPIATEPGSALVAVTVREADGGAFTRTFLVSIGEDGKVWQNTANPRDVDNSGFVVPLDVLLLINELNNPRFRDPSGRLPLPPPEGTPPPYFDVNGDSFITPLDVLIVINFINNRGSGEGESSEVDETIDSSAAIAPSLILPLQKDGDDRQVGSIMGQTMRQAKEAARVEPFSIVAVANAPSAREEWFAGLADADENILFEVELFNLE